MPPVPITSDEIDLLKRFVLGGHVEKTATEPHVPLRAKFLRECVRLYSKRKGQEDDCDSVSLRDFIISGELNLDNLGLEGSPLVSLQLLSCQLTDGISLEYAFTKSLAFIDMKAKYIKSKGVTVIDLLRLQIVRVQDGGYIDISESRLKGGVFSPTLPSTTRKRSLVPLSLSRGLL